MSTGGRADGLADGTAERAPDCWAALARSWALVGPPLRPSPEDVAIVRSEVQRWSRTGGAPRALILGVTPELYRLGWPAGTDLLAVDHSRGMIEAVWPGPAEAAIEADWTAMPLPDASRNIAVCDGGLILIPYPEAHHRLVRELHRVVAADGLCIIRLFTPPAEPESPDAVLHDMLAGAIADVNALKLRLWPTLQSDLRSGVEVRKYWDAVHASAPDLDALASRIGWSPAHLHVLDAYRNSRTRYCFPDVEEVRLMFCDDPGGFDLLSVLTPGYPLGDRCPTLVLRRR